MEPLEMCIWGPLHASYRTKWSFPPLILPLTQKCLAHTPGDVRRVTRTMGGAAHTCREIGLSHGACQMLPSGEKGVVSLWASSSH